MTPPPDTTEFICPHCGQIFAAAVDASGEDACPHCGGTVTIDAALAGPDDAAAEDAATSAAAHERLSLEHIRRLTKLRRAAHRSRAYAVVAALGCFGGLLDALVMAARVRARGDRHWMFAWLLIAAVAAAGTIACAIRARRFRREASQPLPEPQTPPDFSALGDGSERWKSLEDVS